MSSLRLLECSILFLFRSRRAFLVGIFESLSLSLNSRSKALICSLASSQEAPPRGDLRLTRSPTMRSSFPSPLRSSTQTREESPPKASSFSRRLAILVPVVSVSNLPREIGFPSPAESSDQTTSPPAPPESISTIPSPLRSTTCGVEEVHHQTPGILNGWPSTSRSFPLANFPSPSPLKA